MDYVMPTEFWITERFGPALLNFLDKNDFRYRDEQYECNKYAKTASTLADWAHLKTKNEESALAFGCFGFLTKEGAGHMINFAIHRDNKKELYLAFYEPQPQRGTLTWKCLKPVELTKEEISSCISCVLL
jgi:hypothetical protein